MPERNLPDIRIVLIGTGSTFWIKPLITGITDAFALKTQSERWDINLNKSYNAIRQQYDSSQILLQLIGKTNSDTTKTIGIVDVDLFIPILTFVFGEAQLNGHFAIVSMHRLNNKYYGLPEDNELLIQRLIKEAIHELGHTFGLLHCLNPECVMKSATYVEDIDQKGRDFCSQCRQKLTGN